LEVNECEVPIPTDVISTNNGGVFNACSALDAN